MSKKNIVFLILALTLIIVAFLGLWWYNEKKKNPYSTFIKPRMDLTYYQVKTFSKEKTTMNMIMLIDNHAPFNFTIHQLGYKIFIGDVEIMKSTYPKTVELKKGDSASVILPVTIFNEKMIQTLKSLEDRKVDSVDYRIKGMFYTNIPFLKNKPINFDVVKKGPLIRIPKAKVTNVKLDKLGMNETKLLIKTEIQNPNVFPLKFKDTYFRIKLKDEKALEGNIDTAVIIPAKGKQNLNLPLKINLKEAGKTMLGLLTKPSKQTYSFYLETKLVSDDRSLKDSKIITKDEGKIEDVLSGSQ